MTWCDLEYCLNEQEVWIWEQDINRIKEHICLLNPTMYITHIPICPYSNFIWTENWMPIVVISYGLNIRKWAYVYIYYMYVCMHACMFKYTNRHKQYVVYFKSSLTLHFELTSDHFAQETDVCFRILFRTQILVFSFLSVNLT